MAQQKGSGYVAPKAVYKPTPAPKYVNRKQKDEDYYAPPVTNVPAWLGSALGNLNNLGTPSGLGGGNAIVPNFNTPASISQGQALQRANVMQRTANRDDVAPTSVFDNLNNLGMPTGLGGGNTLVPNFNTPASISQGQALQRANVMQRTANRDDVAPAETIFNPRTGQTGNNLQLSDVLAGIKSTVSDVLAGVGSSIYVPPGLSAEQRAAVEEVLRTRATQYAPRENVGNLPAPRAMASQHAPRENINNYYQYLASLEPEVDPNAGFGTYYGGNWGGGGGGGYGGGGYSSPGWLDPRYLNLYDWKWRS